MDEIKKAIFDILKDDGTMQGYTGYTASDPRIYEWYPSKDPVLSSTLPGYITYRFVGPTARFAGAYTDRAGEGDILAHFDVFAATSDDKGQIALRIRTLLDQYGKLSTTNYIVLNIQISEFFEMPVEGESSSDRRYRHHVTARLMAIQNKNTIGINV